MRTKDFAILGAFSLLIAATRWPFAPKYLFYFDSVNHALALEEFDPRKHQPQPPGYPAYVALCRVLYWMGFSAEDTFVASGVVAGALCAWLLWRLGREWGSERAGWMAAVLFSVTPVFWFNSLTNQGRGFAAVASAGTAWLCLRASQRESSAWWLAGATCFLAVLAGFRPVASVMLIPLLLWAAWQRRAGVRELGLAVIAGLLPVLLWGGWLLAASGGLESYLTMMADYARAEGVVPPGTEIRPWKAFFKTVEFVGAIHLVTFLPWFWLLFVRRPALRGRWLFLAVWALPGLAFQIFGHAADPGHLLATVTVLCFVGGLTLAELPLRPAMAALAASCVLSAALFAHPLRGAARATSYNVIRRVNHSVSEAIDTIRAQGGATPPNILLRDTLVTYRHLVYYLPGARVFTWLPDGTVGTNYPVYPLPAAEEPVWVLSNRDGVQRVERWDEALRLAAEASRGR